MSAGVEMAVKASPIIGWPLGRVGWDCCRLVWAFLAAFGFLSWSSQGAEAVAVWPLKG